MKLGNIRLNMTVGIAEGSDDAPRLYGQDAMNGVMVLMQTVPYDIRTERYELEFQFTEAGHILGSALIEVRADGRNILFSGDMGNDFAPILRRPTRHREADLVLVESTYGPSPRVPVNFRKFGEQVMRVIAGGGSVLLPAFVLHRTQALIFIINCLKSEGVIDPRVPVYSDTSTAKEVTKVYHRYEAYYAAGELIGRRLFLWPLLTVSSSCSAPTRPRRSAPLSRSDVATGPLACIAMPSLSSPAGPTPRSRGRAAAPSTRSAPAPVRGGGAAGLCD